MSLKNNNQYATENEKTLSAIIPWASITQEPIKNIEQQSDRRQRVFSITCNTCGNQTQGYAYYIKNHQKNYKTCSVCSLKPALQELSEKFKHCKFKVARSQKLNSNKINYKIEASCLCGNVLRTEYHSNFKAKGVKLRCFKCHPKPKDMTEEYFFSLFENTDDLVFSTSMFEKDVVRTRYKCSHGHLTDITIRSFLNKEFKTCGKCSKKISSMEKQTIKYLEENNILFRAQYFPKDLRSDLNRSLSIDIVTDKFYIELDGQQHFKFTPMFHKTQEKFIRQLINDELKDAYCKKHNIWLIRVPFFYGDHILEYLDYRLKNPEVENNVSFRKEMIQQNKDIFLNSFKKIPSNGYIMLSEEEAEKTLLNIDNLLSRKEIVKNSGLSDGMFLDLLRGQNRFEFMVNNIIRKKAYDEFYKTHRSVSLSKSMKESEEFKKTLRDALNFIGNAGGYLTSKQVAIKTGFKLTIIRNILYGKTLYDDPKLPEILEKRKKGLLNDDLIKIDNLRKLLLFNINGAYLSKLSIRKIVKGNDRMINGVIEDLIKEGYMIDHQRGRCSHRLTMDDFKKLVENKIINLKETLEVKNEEGNDNHKTCNEYDSYVFEGINC